MTIGKRVGTLPLFEQYHLLGEKLPHVSLGEFPTPVQRLERLGAQLGIGHLYMKRDDLSGRLYGGNKPRKLEFILGDAIRSGATEVVTFGGAGSNHALATAVYAQYLGLKSISMLVPQPNARYVRDNLLMSHCCGAELHSVRAGMESTKSVPLVFLATVYQLVRHRVKSGRFPYLIPPGGSSPLGVAGFVNAAFELRKQVTNDEMPEPEYVYVACGTMGTAAGLLLGLRAARLKSHVVSVRVTSEKFVNTGRMTKLINRTNSLIHSLDPSFPMFEFSPTDADIRHGYFGKRYALFTNEGMEAVSLMRECEDIKLDGTYTGKALAALIDDARNGNLRGKSVLFWNTLNSRSHPESMSNLDYHELPRCFHRYFEEDVQPLDRDSDR
jgi:1-aminocyclopropane-1-carboxylate deaminase/D-cysteine desulfhydrase-like pyridoxal-dependent ACC family enzyme